MPRPALGPSTCPPAHRGQHQWRGAVKASPPDSLTLSKVLWVLVLTRVQLKIL